MEVVGLPLPIAYFVPELSRFMSSLSSNVLDERRVSNSLPYTSSASLRSPWHRDHLSTSSGHRSLPTRQLFFPSQKAQELSLSALHLPEDKATFSKIVPVFSATGEAAIFIWTLDRWGRETGFPIRDLAVRWLLRQSFFFFFC